MTTQSSGRDPIEKLAEEFAQRYRRGERPSLTEYATRYHARFVEQARGALLAKGHARSTGATMLSGYLGKSDVSDRAFARFAHGYADQTEADHQALLHASSSDRERELRILPVRSSRHTEYCAW